MIRKNLLLVCASALVATGCMTTTWDPDPIELRPLQSGGDISGVVVSDFYSSLYQTSGTISGDILSLREAVRIDDVSFDVAAKLADRGVTARAAVEADVSSLEPGEVLVRGAFVTTGTREDPLMFFRVIGYGLTLYVYGGVIPALILPMWDTIEYELRVDVIDADGNIRKSDRIPIEVRRQFRWIWHAFEPSYREEDFYAGLDRATDAVADFVANALL